ncbi:hypothetical protein QUQ76_004873 [Escherichia coli]|nr:hypothetical protein [Escherichia coli]
MRLKWPVFLLSLSLIPGFCSADWNVRGMNNTSSITRAVISSDASISIGISGSRMPSYDYVCNVQGGQPIYNTWKYLVWFIEDIKVNNTTVSFDAPRVVYDSVAQGGYFTVEKSAWIDGGKTLVIVGRDTVKGIVPQLTCWAGQSYNFSGGFAGKPVGVSLPAGTHMLTLNLRVMRIQDSGNAEHAFSLAISNRARSHPTTLSAPITVNSYCTNNKVSDITLNHGKFATGTGNGKEVSAVVEYECNMDVSAPKVVFTGADVASGNQVKICDGLTSMLSATTERIQGYNFRTIFKSTLSGNASSSCAGVFSKSVVAVISPP